MKGKEKLDCIYTTMRKDGEGKTLYFVPDYVKTVQSSDKTMTVDYEKRQDQEK